MTPAISWGLFVWPSTQVTDTTQRSSFRHLRSRLPRQPVRLLANVECISTIFEREFTPGVQEQSHDGRRFSVDNDSLHLHLHWRQCFTIRQHCHTVHQHDHWGLWSSTTDRRRLLHRITQEKPISCETESIGLNRPPRIGRSANSRCGSGVVLLVIYDSDQDNLEASSL